MESHAHRLAKELLAGWLRDKADWRSKRLPDTPETRDWPDFGEGRVFVEYPIVDKAVAVDKDCTGLELLWDESGYLPDRGVPTYEQLCAASTPPFVIADIVTTHKGNIRACIEVVHKNPITPLKLERLTALQHDCPCGGFQVWTVPAHWILHQIGVPVKFAGTRVL
jgi:hypothetical protein